jgi:hypothetical protein
MERNLRKSAPGKVKRKKNLFSGELDILNIGKQLPWGFLFFCAFFLKILPIYQNFEDHYY